MKHTPEPEGAPLTTLGKAYADSPGFACWNMRPEPEVGHTFTWGGKSWEVVAYFPVPCCGTRIGLVRREGGSLDRWMGIGCPKKCTEATWTVER